jgi:hypothetical protein
MNPANFIPMFVSSDPELRIKNLEKENAELKAKVELLQKMYNELLKITHSKPSSYETVTSINKSS